MPWRSLLFKKKDPVYARVDAAGEVVSKSGFVEIRYQLDGKSYRALSSNLSPPEGGPGEIFQDPAPPPEEAPKAPAQPKGAEATPTGAVIIYADGACSGNPGPAGLGVFFRVGDEIKELSEYLGHATNNIAELTAVKRALELCADRERPIYIYTDSAYTIGLLTKDWKPKANQELVRELRAMVRRFPRLYLRKVAGHAGIPGNERADLLARQAIERRDTHASWKEKGSPSKEP
jgi:ribonuclease HI